MPKSNFSTHITTAGTRRSPNGSAPAALSACDPNGLPRLGNAHLHGWDLVRRLVRVSEYDYDLIVIGSGPGGQKAAIAAAKLGKRVAIIDKYDMIGGVGVNTGTIPSKTLREAVLYLTGMNQRELYGDSYRVKQDITITDLLARTQHVVGREVQVVRAQLLRNHIDLVIG